MFKLFKYEIVGRIKLMAAVVLGIFLLNTLLTYKLGGATIDRNTEDMALGLTFLIAFTAGVIAFFNAVIVFKRDLYSETGYLIFTLPKKAYYIINTKLSAALVELGIYEIIGCGFLLIRFYKYDQAEITRMIQELGNHKIETAEILVLTLLTIMVTYLLVYFSLALSRATFGNRRYGEFLAIVIFILISFLIGRITFAVSNIVDFRTLANFLGASGSLLCMIGIHVAMSIALIVGTHFVIEKKVDL